jgi:glycosyltransferase involved in cell wall biosynthesis
MKNYNKVFITNLPSFYKTNLYSEINSHIKILVIFTGNDSKIRNQSFYNDNYKFDFIDLSSKSILQKILIVGRIANQNKYLELVIGGWDSILYWICAFLSPKLKNSVVVESSYHESTVKGLKGFIKRVFVKRISKTYASGYSQEKLMLDLNFRGKIIKTKGVGLFNVVEQPKFLPSKIVTNFLYVGRFSEEKNLVNLLQTFNQFPNLRLNLIGYGPQENLLKSLANKNIHFLGSITNHDLPQYYQANDVFVLPSSREPWGLVVEEALNNGLPVILSDKVGCSKEIVQNDNNGIIFNIDKENDLQSAIVKMSNVSIYNILKENVSNLNFKKSNEDQVNCYIK